MIAHPVNNGEALVDVRNVFKVSERVDQRERGRRKKWVPLPSIPIVGVAVGRHIHDADADAHALCLLSAVRFLVFDSLTVKP